MPYKGRCCEARTAPPPPAPCARLLGPGVSQWAGQPGSHVPRRLGGPVSGGAVVVTAGE